MKALSVCLLAVFILTGFRQPASAQAPRIVTADLNNDHRIDSIFLSSTTHSKWSFNKIVISLTGYGRQSFVAKEKWVTVDTEFLADNKNAVRSKWLFAATGHHQTVILLFGWLYEDGRDEFSIINIENNQARMIFDDTNNVNVEAPEKLIDIDGDGRLDFIFRQYAEAYEYDPKQHANIVSYQPFYVYNVNEKSCDLNKALTKTYNEKHYVWAGFQAGAVKVLSFRNGRKPVILKQ